VILDDQMRTDYCTALRAAAACLDVHLNEAALNKAETLRAIGQGVSLLLALAVDVLNGPVVNSGPDPRQLRLFRDSDDLSDVNGAK